jgi:hypothetical protein
LEGKESFMILRVEGKDTQTLRAQYYTLRIIKTLGIKQLSDLLDLRGCKEKTEVDFRNSKKPQKHFNSSQRSQILQYREMYRKLFKMQIGFYP